MWEEWAKHEHHEVHWLARACFVLSVGVSALIYMVYIRWVWP